jgi:hypothetical protein
MASWLLSMEAAIEAVTGVALVVQPQTVAHLLLGADLNEAGLATARVAGIALIALGAMCWTSRQLAVKSVALTSMLIYNSVVTAYLMGLALGGDLVGLLLWPAIVIHAALTIVTAHEGLKEWRPRINARR